MTSDASRTNSEPQETMRRVIDRGIPVNTHEWVEVINAANALLSRIEFLEAQADELIEIGRGETKAMQAEIERLTKLKNAVGTAMDKGSFDSDTEWAINTAFEEYDRG